MESEQSEVDKAIRDFEARISNLRKVIQAAEQSNVELTRLAEQHASAARTAYRRSQAEIEPAVVTQALEDEAASRREAEELAGQAADQVEQLDNLRLQLSNAIATTETLKSQRSTLLVRLNAASASGKTRVSGPGAFGSHGKWPPVGVVAVGMGVLVFGLVVFAFRGDSTADRFAGRWRVTRSDGMTLYFITLNSDFTAETTNVSDQSGTWETVGDEARIIWLRDWKDRFRPTGARCFKMAYKPGTNWDDEPTDTLEVIREP